MMESSRTDAGPLPPEQVLELERACDRFEAAWRVGRRPRAEDFLDAVRESGRPRLLRELLTLEVAYRRRDGESPTPEEYRGRLPGRDDLIDLLFHAMEDGSLPDTQQRAPDRAGSGTGADAAPGAIGRYLVVGQLDKGGQGDVFRVVHPGLGKDLVLKLARHSIGSDAGASLVSEGRLLAQIDHPNLVRVLDLDIHEGRPYVVMEYVPGTNLQQYAGQAHPTARTAAGLMTRLARVVGAVHRKGLIHLDIKPKNVLMDEAGRPRLIDFGLARLRHAWGDAAEGSSGGTLAYMPPE
jgi:hypothetical protein